MSQGIVFNIQKFSIHDGPGIRTTVFLKGCPLRCKWCANPESQLEDIQILHDEDKCSLCKTCIHTCTQNALSLTNDSILIDPTRCVKCLDCIKQCPTSALSLEGEYKTVDEVLAVCLQDIDFYDESDGGVTISGGEGMIQPEFVTALIKRLKEHNIHTAIETTGYIKQYIFQRLAPMFDLLLFDVKQYDSELHRQGTGVTNELILENLSWALKQNINVLPRIPVIPDFNSTLEDAKGFTKLFQDIGVKKVQLLPFHQFGENKYHLLKRNYLYEKVEALHPEDLVQYQQIFLDAGIQCYF